MGRPLLACGVVMTMACMSPVPENVPPRRLQAQQTITAWVTSSRTPGVQYVHVDASGVVFEYNAGWADLWRQQLVTSNTSMMAYSISKTLTAVAVLQLAGEGVVDLSAPVSRYLPGLPYGDGVTIQHLLTHTGGLPNPVPLRWVHAREAHASFDEAAAVATVLQDHPRLRSEPGTRYAYSNIGYWLLGAVVEHATGESFPTYVRHRIFEPLGLSERDAAYTVADLDHHATGYLERYSLLNLVKPLLFDRALTGSHRGRWLEIRPHYPNGPAFGGLVCTARALGAFLTDQLRPHSVLLNDDMRRMLYMQARTSGGDTVPMTLGWHVSDDRARAAFYFKEGGGGGFHGMMRLYPGEGRGSAVLTNATAFDVTRALDTIDALLMFDTTR